MVLLFRKEGRESGVEGWQWGVGCGTSSWSVVTVAADRRGGSGRRRNVIISGRKWTGGGSRRSKEVITKATIIEVKNMSSYGA